MELLHLIVEHWEAATGFVGVIAAIAVSVYKFKQKPDHKEVKKMIDDAFANHCPFSDDLEVLLNWKKVREKEIAIERQDMQKKMDTILIHLKQVCQKLSVDWVSPEL